MCQWIIVLLICGIGLMNAQQDKQKSHHTRDGFRNTAEDFQPHGLGELLKWAVWERLTGQKPAKPDHYNFSIADNSAAIPSRVEEGLTVTWVGHSTLLIQMAGLNILTDPIWSERSSPFQFAGPRRVVPAAVSWDHLPAIDVVLISHDHYDHLDKNTIQRLGNDPHYLTPLGVGEILSDWGIRRFQQLDWGDSVKINGVTFICTPAQHFSGRSPFRRNNTLWSSWVIKSTRSSFYYGGDSGYFPGFKKIGRTYGPFDAAALPIGAYLPRWFMGRVHLNPPEAVQAFVDLGAEYFIAIHWGTFDLADEPLDQPPRDLRQAVAENNLAGNKFLVFRHGETRIIPPINASESIRTDKAKNNAVQQ